MKRVRLRLPLLLFLATPTQAQTNSQVPFYEGDPNFLMIGNSYTGVYKVYNAVDSMIKSLFPEWKDTANMQAAWAGGRTFTGHVSTAEGLTDDTGIALNDLLITNPEPWKWVVLQEQSQTSGYQSWDWDGSNFGNSRDAAVVLNDYIAQTGGQTLFYMTWGRLNGDKGQPDWFPDYPTMQEEVIQGYIKYVEATSTDERPTYVAPVGMVFQTLYNDLVAAGVDPTEEGTVFNMLYQNDGSHQSGMGVYVAALTIVTTMFGFDPAQVDFVTGNLAKKNPEEVLLIKDAVSRTVLKTFESGFIKYPWKASWKMSSEGTNTPATDAPTISPGETPTPVALPPTDAPTTGTTAPTGPIAITAKGSITIEIQYDMFPRDIAWTFLHKTDNVTKPLFFQPFNGFKKAGNLYTQTFKNLTQTGTYLFKMRDENGDGLSDTGYVRIMDDNNFGRSTVLFQLESPTFETYFEVDLTVGSYGQATVTGKSDIYVPSTWPDLESEIWQTNYIGREYEWPGNFPTDPVSSIVVNVDLDEAPEESSWALYKLVSNSTLLKDEDPENDWKLVDSWNGTSAMTLTLNSTEVSSLKQGLYRFVIMDSAQNGLCCDAQPRKNNGYVTLTGPLAATQTEGLIWGHNGDFAGQELIEFRMDKDGYVAHVQWDNSGARTLAPSAAPSTAPSESLAPSQSPTEAADNRGEITAKPAGPAKIPSQPGAPTSAPTSAPVPAAAPSGPMEEAEYVSFDEGNVPAEADNGGVFTNTATMFPSAGPRTETVQCLLAGVLIIFMTVMM